MKISFKQESKPASRTNLSPKAPTGVRDFGSEVDKFSGRAPKKAAPPAGKTLPGIDGFANPKQSPRWRRQPGSWATKIQSRQQQSAANPKTSSAAKTVSLSFAIPTWFGLPSPRQIKQKLGQTSKKVRLITSAVLAVIVLLVVGHHLFIGSSPAATSTSIHSQGPPKLSKGTPNYATILPAGKSIADLGGWTRISPPSSAAVYTYVDHIAGILVDVSEQPLPAALQTDTDTKIEQLAEGYSATDKFTSGGGTTVYVGTSAQGPQSVILTKNNLLILIKSGSTLTNNQWATYINSLR